MGYEGQAEGRYHRGVLASHGGVLGRTYDRKGMDQSASKFVEACLSFGNCAPTRKAQFKRENTYSGFGVQSDGANGPYIFQYFLLS